MLFVEILVGGFERPTGMGNQQRSYPSGYGHEQEIHCDLHERIRVLLNTFFISVVQFFSISNFQTLTLFRSLASE